MRNARLCAAAIITLAALYSTAVHAAPNGKIHAGDMLYIEVYRAPDLSRVYAVAEDGTIRMPFVSPIPVGGMDEPAAAKLIASSLEPIMRSPRVTVSHSDGISSNDRNGRTADMRLEIIPLRNSNAESMAASLEGMTTPGGSVSADQDTNSLLLTDTPEAIKNMMNVIARLDQMQSQITQVRIETKVAEVRVGALKELGVRWFAQGDNAMGGFIPPPNRLLSNTARTGGFGPQSNEFINKNNGNSFNNGTEREFVGDNFDRRLNIPVTVPLPGQSFLGYTTGGIDIGAMIDALATDEKAKVLANPTILTVNHKPAEIKMVDEYPYTEFGTEISGQTNFSVKFLELGIILDVTPHVYEDTVGTYVRLNLKPQVSFPSGIANGVPIRSLRTSDTVANVRDGQTLVVGGILTEDEADVVTKVPGIGDLPIFGNLFKTKEKQKFRNELMIFVTPTVHRRPEEITWDRMVDVASGLNELQAAPSARVLGNESRKE